MFKYIKRLDRQSRALFVAASVVIVITVGLVDYATGREISCSVFYLVAVAVAAWFVGRGFAVFISFLSVVVSLVGDLAAGPRYSSVWVIGWNASIVLAFSC
jgi:K+-sensing histidine kinase KdpD